MKKLTKIASLAVASLAGIGAADATKIENFQAVNTTVGSTVVNGVRVDNNTLPVAGRVFVLGRSAYGLDPNDSIYGGYIGGIASNQSSTATIDGVASREATGALQGLLADALHNSSSANLASAGSSANSGSHTGKKGFWGRVGYKRIDDKTLGGKWDANLWSFMIGADYKVMEKLVIGLALNYSYMDGRTVFNRGTVKDHSYGVLPYLTFNANKWLSVDLMGGYNRVDKDRKRQPITRGSAQVTAKPKGDRWFASLFANLKHTINKANLLARFGYTHVEDIQKGFRESNGDLYRKNTFAADWLTARLQAGYKMTDMVEPYIFGTYGRELHRKKVNFAQEIASVPTYYNPEQRRGKDDIGGGLGLNLTGRNGWSGGMEYAYNQVKKARAHTGTARLRYQW